MRSTQSIFAHFSTSGQEQPTTCFLGSGIMAHSSPDSKIVQVVHLARDALYEKEKPYFADFPVPGRSRNNHRLEVRDIRIKDARSIRDDLTIDRQGFCLLDCPTSVALKLLKRDESAVLEYYEQMEAFVLQLQGCRVRALGSYLVSGWTSTCWLCPF